MSKVTGAVPDPESLRDRLKSLREFPPKVRTGVRRELRAVGDEVIAEQRAILSGPLPSGTAKTGWRHKRVEKKSRGKGTGKFYLVKVNTYSDAAVRDGGRSTGMRDGIKAGLRTRVVTGKTRQGIEIKTTGPKVDGFNQAKVWNKRRFRHPVFGNKEKWADQKGQPYYRRPIMDGRDDLLRRTEEILNRAADQT
ncbi:hypothetical protein [Microbacterium allomyrinae]|uniref:HK97 gp10 family phage protein n=1 Tax=Microbacterium allomyrinae TaxID=2830666 RepID=A0A9X1S1A6_9MICO|nr:hypothetical protein [Microbacterium allomyrinae]MCC2030614.1 hypothetical protein [Microbacterium allomyrinae]